MSADAADRCQVHIINCGESYACGTDQTLLAGMEALGRRGIPVGCRGGGCGICKIHIRSGRYRVGKMSRACVSAEEAARGIVLACKTHPCGDVELEVVGAMARRLAPPSAAAQVSGGKADGPRPPSAREEGS